MIDLFDVSGKHKKKNNRCNDCVLDNIVIVGDPKQLQPYWPDHTFRTEGHSIYNNTLQIPSCSIHETMLKVQYRCPPQINNLLNKLFYKEGKEMICCHKIPFTTTCIFWHHCETCIDRDQTGEVMNNNVKEICEIRKFLDDLPENANFMIVTPYRNQKRKMISMYPNLESHIYTVDQAQGIEADYVLLSLVKNVATSFMNTHRCCVAFSRAKKELHVFGNYYHGKNKLGGKNEYIASLHAESKLVEGE